MRKSEKLKLPIEVLELSVRTESRLFAANVRTLEDLARMNKSEALKSFGISSFKEVKSRLGEMGLSFLQSRTTKARPPSQPASSPP